jgi:hypothetical protein
MPLSQGELHYRTYFLACDLSKDRLYDRTRTAFLCRTAALTELAIQGLILDEGKHPRAAAGGASDDPVLAMVLAQISAHDRSWQDWLRRSYKETLAATESSLQSANAISVAHSKVLGLFQRTRITVSDRASVAAAQEAVRAILLDTTPADQVSLPDAAAVSLAAIGRIPAVVSSRDARAHADRIDALTRRVGALSPGLEKAYRGLGTVMVAAQGGIGS